MCILCVASRWSRRIVTMLPWLVIPLIILWALSQLLPPGFRFEVTSPRLACVAVLLVSLGWYEIVMPKVSAWRARRRALLREKKRIEAQEVAKWRKEATRRCRNCYTPYKDQAPGGGRFMCTYCGHVSKRPVLDIPTSNAGNTFSLSGSTAGLMNGNAFLTSRNPKIWNGRGPNGLGGGRTWAGGRPWIDGGSWGINGSWFGSSWPGSAYYFGTAGTGWPGAGTFMGSGIFAVERCSTGESYFGIFWFLLRLLSYLIFVVDWVWRKLLKAGYSGDGSLDRGHRSQSRSDDSVPSPETRGEKARRKAEEKRAARLEKEQLEAEERKQREEVARLVEERRRLRDELLEAEKESEREAAAEREREIRRERETERRRQEKLREKEKNQVKEKSKDQDSEELRKRKGKENEKKSDPDKNENEDSKTSSATAPKAGKLDVKAVEAGSKGHASRWTGSKYLGSAKTSFWGRNFTSSSNVTGKATKTPVPGTGAAQSNTNSSIESGRPGNKGAGSAWNRLQWSNVWGRTSNKAPCDASNKVEHTGHAEKKTDSSSTDTVRDCIYSCTVKDPSGSETANNVIGNEAVKGLIDGSVISSPPVQQPQQPIAPPSSVSATWDNLFSGPVCFPPVELPVDSGYQEQRQSLDGTVTQEVPYTSPALSTHSYFEAPGLIAPPPQVSCTYPDPAETAVSSLPPSVSSSLNMIDFSGPDIHSSLSEIRPLADPVMSNTATNFRTNLNPLSPVDDSGMNISRETDYISTNTVLDPWHSPTTPIDSICSSSREGIWNNWSGLPSQQMNFLPSSPWDSPFHEPLQALSPNVRERSYNSSSHSQSTFFLQEKTDRSSRFPFSEPSCPIPAVGCNNWRDVSSVESMMHAWEDADINQRVPPEFVDCITHSLMQDPVITADGHSYERSAIEEWLKSHDTSPKTGEVLPPPPNGIGVDKTLRPNHILRGQIIEYLERLSRRGSREVLINSGWNTDEASISSSSWPPKAGIQTRSSIRGFYPTPPVWSYNV